MKIAFKWSFENYQKQWYIMLKVWLTRKLEKIEKNKMNSRRRINIFNQKRVRNLRETG